MRWRRHTKKAKRAIRKANRSTDAIEVKPGYLPWKLTCTKTTTRKRLDMEERTTHSDWTDTRPALLVDTRQFDVETEHDSHVKTPFGIRQDLRIKTGMPSSGRARKRLPLRNRIRRDANLSKTPQEPPATTSTR